MMKYKFSIEEYGKEGYVNKGECKDEFDFRYKSRSFFAERGGFLCDVISPNKVSEGMECIEKGLPFNYNTSTAVIKINDGVREICVKARTYLFRRM